MSVPSDHTVFLTIATLCATSQRAQLCWCGSGYNDVSDLHSDELAPVLTTNRDAEWKLSLSESTRAMLDQRSI